MRIDPAIAALRRDRALQRRAQARMAAACDAWRAAPGVHEVLAAFERYGQGAPLADCPALQAVFTDRETAPRVVAALTGEFCCALGEEPFGHPPLRHGYDRGTATLLLARRGRAQFVLHASEPDARRFDTVTFSDAERFEAVLAGEARGRTVRRKGRFGRFAEQPLVLGAGARLEFDMREEAPQVLAIDRRLVALRLHRTAPNPAPTREYDLATGALLRQSAGGIRMSRHEIMLALLGRMRRADAAPVMAAIACEPGDASLRWQALRECLALDTGAGFAALRDLAHTEGDPLAAQARALQARLVEAHPVLRTFEAASCLA